MPLASNEAGDKDIARITALSNPGNMCIQVI